jgi:hypothetical protein
VEESLIMLLAPALKQDLMQKLQEKATKLNAWSFCYVGEQKDLFTKKQIDLFSINGHTKSV